MRIALDTNILVYSEGGDDTRRQRDADALIVGLADHELVLPIQVAAELYRYLVRKKKLTASEARTAIASWRALMARQVETTFAVFDVGVGIAADHQLQIFDAIILAAAAEANCDLLLSEDMQDGFVSRGVTVANPFAARLHPLLADALGR